MTRVVIPSWNANGVIPPVNSTAPTGAERSPYIVSLSEFVLRFATSPKRQQILAGFLRHRNRLHTARLVQGFQWIDGSFLENIEVTETRDPNDIDVVTFFSMPVGLNQLQVQALAPDAFPVTNAERATFKAAFLVDPYFVSLGSRAQLLVQQSAYWYSMWSHRRDTTWKGFLQIDLDPSEDALAAIQLRTPAISGGTP
jgi:hypothetical protein